MERIRRRGEGKAEKEANAEIEGKNESTGES